MEIKIPQVNQVIAKIVFSGQVFPVYRKDTLETVMERYVKTYPTLAEDLIQECDEVNKSLYNESAMSKDMAILKMATKIPVPVFYAMKYFDNEYWDYKLGEKHYRLFAQLYPKLKIGRK